MNIRISRKWMISAAVTVGLLLAVWAVGSVLAQGPDESQPTPPMVPLPLDGPPGRTDRPLGPVGGVATKTHAFTYQGVLEFDGTPVTGYYDFYINLWSNSNLDPLGYLGNCDDPTGIYGDGYVLDVYVEQGVFTLYLICGVWNPQTFNGGERWLEFWVQQSGTPGWTQLSPPQPISPVPAAFSLFPGATVYGGVASSSAALSVTQTLDVGGFDDAFAIWQRPRHWDLW